MSKVGLNIGNVYTVVSTPLSPEELKNTDVKPNQLIISSTPTETTHDGKYSCLLASDNNGNILNINDTTSLYKMCSNIGSIFLWQTTHDNKLTLSYTLDERSGGINNECIKNTIINTSENNKYMNLGYVSQISYTECINIEFESNDIFKSNVYFDTPSRENNISHISNLYLVPSELNFDTIKSGIYTSILTIGTGIPNLSKSIKIENYVINGDSNFYFGITPNTISSILRSYYIDTQTALVYSDYLSAPPSNSQQIPFMQYCASIYNLKNTDNTLLYNDDTKFIMQHAIDFSDFELTPSVGSTPITFTRFSEIICEKLGLSTSATETTVFASTIGGISSKINYQNPIITSYFYSQSAGAIGSFPTNNCVWVIMPTIVNTLYESQCIIHIDSNSSLVLQPLDDEQHTFIHDNNEYIYIQYGNKWNFYGDFGAEVVDISKYANCTFTIEFTKRTDEYINDYIITNSKMNELIS